MIDLGGNWGLLKTHITYAAVDTNDNVALKLTKYSHFWLKRIIATSYVGFLNAMANQQSKNYLFAFWGKLDTKNQWAVR
jgi:hypothetical protein